MPTGATCATDGSPARSSSPTSAVWSSAARPSATSSTTSCASQGGHIGYAVRPAHRRRGYATEILRQSLIIARAVGVDRVLVTCDDTNVGSSAVIEACGGVLDDVVPAGETRDGGGHPALLDRLMAAPLRRAVVLFVPPPVSVAIDEIRMRWDPVMCARIGAHITLVHDVVHHDRVRQLGRGRGGDVGSVHRAPHHHRALGPGGLRRVPARRGPERWRSPRCTRTSPTSRSRGGRGSRSVPTARSCTAARRRRPWRRGHGRELEGLDAGWDVEVAGHRHHRDGRADRLAHRRAVRADAGARRRLNHGRSRRNRCRSWQDGGDRSTGEWGTIDEHRGCTMVPGRQLRTGAGGTDRRSTSR